MKAYAGTFTKANGSKREMRFIRLGDLPDGFMETKIKGTGKQKVLSEGLELVWDIDQQGFRMFNWNTAEEVPETFEIENI